MAEEKKCFIIMPITTTESMSKVYRDGEEHFKHVLECLFIPAIKKAGYVPMPPIAKGSDLIHAEIINNLETADLVLCDMSSLNPNVFFEFGIRTSLNKPVSVVKDELTKTVPFDAGIINHQEYKSSLDAWHLDSDINKLSEHINASYSRSNGKNTLWKYFGLKSEVIPYKSEAGSDSKLDYLTLQLDSLREKIDELSRNKRIDNPIGISIPYAPENKLLIANLLWEEVISNIRSEDNVLAAKLSEAKLLDIDMDTGKIVIGLSGGMTVLKDSIMKSSLKIESEIKKVMGGNLKLSVVSQHII
ncbi:MAG: hypothetical protein HZC48_05550 [Nitrospirae bacterium]|nr:hypothetical protein [Nitrospirota bacterium]